MNNNIKLAIGAAAILGVVTVILVYKNKKEDTLSVDKKTFLNSAGERTASTLPDTCTKCQKEANSNCNSGYSFVYDGYQNCKCSGCVGSKFTNQLPTALA